jgi:hypothetical protein
MGDAAIDFAHLIIRTVHTELFLYIIVCLFCSKMQNSAPTLSQADEMEQH